MREINATEITNAIADLCKEATCYLGDDVISAIEAGLEREESATGKEILSQILENAKIGREESAPVCQDTGVAVVFVELGQDAHIVGGSLEAAINEGVRQGYEEGYLRKSIVRSPIDRVNTGDNTPAVIHTSTASGDKLEITVMAKGGGSENMSRTAMLVPAQGREGVVDFVVDAVRQAGANPCPPIVVGVGLGGTFEKAALLAKKSLLRPLGSAHPDENVASLEREVLDRINESGIGPQGLGGRVTALAVHVETHPCHIASLPVAVNIECHSHRHKSVML